MKKTITAVAALLMTVATFAQTAKTTQDTKSSSTPPAKTSHEAKEHHGMSPEERAKQEVEKMTKVLGLNADMSAKVMTVEVDFIKKRDAIRGNEKKGEMTPEQHKQIDQLKQEKKSQMEKVLGADQMKKWHEYQQANHGKGGEHHEGHEDNEHHEGQK